NQLVLRSFELMMAAWGHNPPAFLLIENVPRIQSRGRAMLDEITAALHAAGYSTVESTHDCGELGGLGQSRKRFLLVARHREKVPPFLYAPPRQALPSGGEVVGALRHRPPDEGP
ncbi:MAG: DNA cytosine methyltransferase, partial [Myxococcota bacterium]